MDLNARTVLLIYRGSPRASVIIHHHPQVLELVQADWRFCGKGMTLFFDGDPNTKGACPAGGGHASIGYNFALPHD